MNLKILFFLILVSLSVQKIKAQSSAINEKFDVFKALGDKFYAEEDYYEAALEYQKAAKLKSDDPYVDFTLAECFRKNLDYDDAEKWYQKTFATHNTHYPLSQFWLGLMQKTNGKYIEAEKTLLEFIKNFKPITEEDKLKLSEADFEYKGCIFALEQLNKPVKDIGLFALPAPVNSKSTEYAPMLFFHDSSLVITSARSDSKGSEFNLATGEAKSDNFRFEKKGARWERMHNDDNFDIVNTPKDDGAGELTKDKKKYYYTICDPECAIYVSKTNNGKFTKAIKLNRNINATGYWNAQPTLSPTSDTMFFVSKRPGGKGQHDIWMSINKDKSGTQEDWGPALNMVKINTPYREISPFWDDHTNTIYFASDGHLGFGGLDVYTTKGTKRDSIVNMGLPFNSNRDDFYFTLGKEKGYLVSNRRGGLGKEDIYAFGLKVKESVLGEVVKNSFADAKSVISVGQLVLNDTKEPLANIPVFLKDESGNTIKQAITNEKGEFRFENLPPDQSFKITFNETDSRIVSKLKNEAENQKLESKVPETSETETSTSLSSKTINDKAKMAQAKSKTKKQTKSKPVINVENEENIAVENPANQTMKAESSVTGAKSNITVQEFKIKSSNRKLSKVLFDNVYFDFNSVDLSSSSKKVLDELLKYYGDHKEIQIEIKSFTDGFGVRNYNLLLAEQRGKACFDYLVGRGVDQTALLLTPIGSANFLGSNNSFVGRQLNRRVEFTIIGAKQKYETEAMAYVIEPKMTLFTIAKKFNMSVEELKNLNGISAVDIKAYSAIRVKRAGNDDVIAPTTIETLQNSKQEFKFKNNQFIPTKTNTAEAVDTETDESYHTVQPSETLYSISKKYNIKTEDLKNLNGMGSNDITVGQKLKIR
jgi:outer membrane protein OmpA-like peptidoglycan-associated protein/LysM repeat protein/tetratricopeptide (TPR) repeat protein